jgi:PKD repeat protein
LVTGLLGAAVLTSVFLVACDTKTPVGPGSVTITTTSVSPQPGGGGLAAAFTVSPTVAMVGQTVTVNASTSTAAPGRSVVAYDWNFGNGVTKSGVTASHDFAAAGAFPIVLTVSDDAGQKATATQTVTVVQPGPTTTSVPPSNAVVHYVATPAVPEVPADLTLLFQLLSSGSILSRLSIIRPMADATYSVSGSWISANKQITGGIKGQFVGTLTPVSGQFTGSLTATVQNDGTCTTERSFTGSLGQALSLAAGTITGPTCSPNPWTYSTVSMTQTSAPPPTTTSTTSTTSSSTTSSSTTSTSTTSTSTTTSTTTTTTSIPVLADLIPFDATVPPGTYCRISPSSGALLVEVRNQGLATSVSFQTRVTFSVSSKPVDVFATSSGLAPSGSTDLSFAIPLGCFGPDCFFSIAVDSGSAVTESNESNNTANGVCIG